MPFLFFTTIWYNGSMTKVKIKSGACGNVTNVEAVSEDGTEVILNVDSGCAAIVKMFEELGDTFDAYQLCFSKPGSGPLYEYTSKAEKYPPHGGCPVVAGVVKAVEAECKLAMVQDASITFEQ